VAIIGNAWYLFGFLYEEVVDVPNMMFGSSAAKAQAVWDPYHWATNPVFYYTIVAFPTFVSLVLLWLGRGELTPANRARLRAALGGHVAVAVLTGIAVTQINGTLYFGSPIGDSSQVHALAWTWFAVNALRIAATGLTVLKLIAIHSDAMTAMARSEGTVRRPLDRRAN
jgi:hypothetical protein